MINSYDDYKRYRNKENNRSSTFKDLIFPNPADRFIKRLRKLELHYNSVGVLHKMALLIAYINYRRISLKTGISIPKNTCDEGLSIPHFGSIVINAACEIGKNCRVHNNVNIGATAGSIKAPKIGDNVYIGPGAVIFGDITIADNCYIGANSVVNKNFLEPFSVIVGAPGRLVRTEQKAWNGKK